MHVDTLLLKAITLLQMVAAVVQFIKQQQRYIFAFLISLVVVYFGCYVSTLQSTNYSVTSRLQSAENQIQQLIGEKLRLKEQLQSTESNNQRLHDEKKELRNEIDHKNAELRSVKDNVQKLLKDKEENEKKISQIVAELQSSKDNMQGLLEEKQTFQKIIDQNNAELKLVRSENHKLLEAKNEVLEKINQIKDDRDVYSTQLLFIEKWIDSIDKLEEHIHAIVHCSESKRKRSSYADPKLCSKISYDFDESYAGELILRVVDLIMKYKVECRKFLDALMLKRVDEMKDQQAIYDMSKIKERMEKLIEEIRDVKYQKRKADKPKIQVVPEHQQSKEKTVERSGGILSTLWNFANWVGGMVAGLFWS